MKSNFVIEDAVRFVLPDESVDLRGECDLTKVSMLPGNSLRVELVWNIRGSNQQVTIDFREVTSFIVSGRDDAYPFESGTTLAIAGFTDASSFDPDGEIFCEPTQAIAHMSFIMADKSAFLIKAASATLRRM